MNNSEILKVAKRVVTEEAKALLVLSNTIDDVFSAAVLKLHERKGRVVLTGVGKSSRIAQKVASTLTSTGTPAFFVHPTEASHGDLGMIQDNDTLIALSRSGESSELKDILVYCKQHSIPIVAITAVVDSALAKRSDFVLRLPEHEEACSLGLAPTTSSIMMLAVGDALAVACLELKRFTKNDFKLLHPAGKLGLNLLKVSDLMHVGKELPLVSSETKLSDAILEITRCRFGCVGITDGYDHLIGIFTDGDLRRNLGSVELTKPISSLMVKNPALLDPDVYVIDAAQTFKNRRIPSAFICEAGRPIGILHIHDLLQRGFL